MMNANENDKHMSELTRRRQRIPHLFLTFGQHYNSTLDLANSVVLISPKQNLDVGCIMGGISW